MDILEAVTERYETLSPAQKRIADYIFKYPDEVCFYSLKEMSEALGVTEVTILRFAKRDRAFQLRGVKTPAPGTSPGALKRRRHPGADHRLDRKAGGRDRGQGKAVP